MSGHSHDHIGHSHSGGGGGGHGGDCGHEHFTHEAGEQQSLYQVVDKENVVALNAENDEMGKAIIKTWDQLEDDTLFCQSEDDGELLIRVPFTDTVKLRSITLRIGGGDAKMPDKMHVYANSSPDFSDLSAATPTQSFDLVASPTATPYHVRVAKFSSITHLTLHFPPPSTGDWEEGDPIRLTYLSFAGEALRLRREVPTGVVYEANASLKDHKRRVVAAFAAASDLFPAGALAPHLESCQVQLDMLDETAKGVDQEERLWELSEELVGRSFTA